MKSVECLYECSHGGCVWSNYSDLTRPKTPNGGLVREIPLFQGNLGWKSCHRTLMPIPSSLTSTLSASTAIHSHCAKASTRTSIGQSMMTTTARATSALVRTRQCCSTYTHAESRSLPKPNIRKTSAFEPFWGHARWPVLRPLLLYMDFTLLLSSPGHTCCPRILASQTYQRERW